MRPLIAKRNRVRDMLTELENDPWAGFTDKAIREVISDDNYALMLAEMQQLTELRDLRRKKEGWSDLHLLFPNLSVYLHRLQENTKYVEQHRGRLAYWNAKLAEAQRMMGIHEKHIRNNTEDVARLYGKLSDQERAFLEHPPANESNILNFPRWESADRGYFYPERTVRQTCVMDKLRVTLAALEKEIAEEGGER